MIERIYSNVAVFHDSERIITTYKFEDSEHSQVVKSHVAKAVSVQRQSRKQAAASSKQLVAKPLVELPSPPVDSPMADDAVASPIALDTPSSLKDDEDMSVAKEEMTEADILEKLAQLKAEKHRLFQQVKNMMVSKEATPATTESVMLVSSDDDSKQSHGPFDIQYSTSQLAGSRPSSPPTSPRNRMYPSPSSPSDHGPHFKNAFKFAERPFSRTPYERRPYSPNTPPLSPPTAGRRPPVAFGQAYRRPGYFNRGMPPRRY
ncbi:hypothetical protein BC943DRAFT_328300 [Umbelopsis sp. AD052]|nr:hypothetical protein BC943DRAFT_328300 [Umbelopsis sp. AD052]